MDSRRLTKNRYGPPAKGTAYRGQMIYGVLVKIWLTVALAGPQTHPLAISLVPEHVIGKNARDGPLTDGLRRKIEAIWAASNREHSEPKPVSPL